MPNGTPTSERTTTLRYPSIRRSWGSRTVVATFADVNQAQEAYRLITTMLSPTREHPSVDFSAPNAIATWDILRTLLRQRSD